MKYNLIQDFDRALEILREVGEWVQTTKNVVFDSWRPENLMADTVFDDMIADKKDFFVLKMDNEFVAALVMSKTDMWEMWNDAKNVQAIYLAKFGKRRKFQDLKIGDIVLNLVKEYAKNIGVNRVRLDVDSTAKGLVELYENNGFKQVGVVSCDEDPVPCILFECVF